MLIIILILSTAIFTALVILLKEEIKYGKELEKRINDLS